MPTCRSAAACGATLGPNGQAPCNTTRMALANLDRCVEESSRTGGRQPMTVPFQSRRPAAGAATDCKRLRNGFNHGGRAAGRGPPASARRALAEAARTGRFDELQRVRQAHDHDPTPYWKPSTARTRTIVRNLARVFLQIAYRRRLRCRKPALDAAGRTQRGERNRAPPFTRSLKDSAANRRAGFRRSLPSRGMA